MVAMIGMAMVLGQPAGPGRAEDVVPPSSVTAVAADGWRATYPSPPAFDPVGAPVTLAVTRPGFDASGAAVSVVDQVVVNGRLRQAYPNQASLTADTVVMNDFIYAGDTLPTGVTNNSTRAYPAPIACWLEHDHFAITGATFAVNLVVAHKFARNGRPVAAVRIIASDGTTTREQLVSSLTWQSWVATGLGVDSYRASFTAADFAAGAAITIDAIIYPWAGPSYRLSVNGNPAPNLKNTVIRGYRVTPVYAYVAATGDNTTGVASTDPATAAASPCQTINGAAVKIRAANNALFARDEIGGGVIRFPVGTWAVGNTTASSSAGLPVTTACLVYESITPADKATTILTDNSVTQSGANIAPRAVVRNLTLRRISATGQLFRSSETLTTALVLQNCDLDRNGQVSEPLWINRFGRLWLIDSRDLSTATAVAQASGASVKNAVAIGSALGGNCTISYVACRLPAVSVTDRANATLGFAQGMLVNSVVSGGDSGAFQVSFGGTFLATPGLGYAVIGNVIETYGSGAGAMSAWADGNTSEVHDFLFLSNTLPGANDQTRFNRLYSDVAGATAPKNMTMRFNVVGRSASKNDVFAAAGAAIGNWPVCMGVAHAHNTLVEGTTPPNSNIGAGSWRYELLYPGIQIGNGAGGVLAPQWTLDASVTGTGAGGGDYRPLGTSPLARVPAGRTIRARDMLGQAIPADGSAFVGALAAAP
jgi:hypothetical protein